MREPHAFPQGAGALSRPLIVAARGAADTAPENTLPAFERALARGADGIGLGVHPTLDGELVVLHDHCLGRTVPGAGPVSRRTLGELRSLDAGSWFGEEFAGALIPTLGEVLELGRGRARFEVELRGIGSGFLDGVLETIDDLGVTEEVELTSSHPPLLLRARAEQPLLRTGVLVGPYPDWRHPGLGTGALIAWLTLLDAQAAHLCPELQVPEVVEPLRRAGFAIHAAEVNDEPGLDAALGLEVQQLSTGCLDLALEKVGPRQERRRAPRARAV